MLEVPWDLHRMSRSVFQNRYTPYLFLWHMPHAAYRGRTAACQPGALGAEPTESSFGRHSQRELLKRGERPGLGIAYRKMLETLRDLLRRSRSAFETQSIEGGSFSNEPPEGTGGFVFRKMKLQLLRNNQTPKLPQYPCNGV